ncbi:MAG TPA: Rieske 2Fe-2S domain-containing protein [Mariprofundaceae bacterium]|nr:Rieske 2Fe-2S domain-containing protein [Mariprofundaceae bacterium]
MTNRVIEWQQTPLPDEEKAITFTFLQHFPAESQIPPHDYEGFIIRYQGKFMAYRNSCPHAGSPMDWLPGQFFSEDGSQLVCHTHDARFDPATGDCISGPCPHGLATLPLRNIESGSVEVPAEIANAIK